MTRSMLLPLPVAATEKMSLQIHLALAACRRPTRGNSYQSNELLRALYITYHLQETGFDALSMQVYGHAELGMNAALSNAKLHQVPHDVFQATIRAVRVSKVKPDELSQSLSAWRLELRPEAELVQNSAGIAERGFFARKRFLGLAQGRQRLAVSGVPRSKNETRAGPGELHISAPRLVDASNFTFLERELKFDLLNEGK